MHKAITLGQQCQRHVQQRHHITTSLVTAGHARLAGPGLRISATLPAAVQGVEFAGTLADFVRVDLRRKYLELMPYVRVTLLQARARCRATWA